MVRIEGNIPFVEPPQWAVLERSLIDLMDASVHPLMERYVRPDGSVLWPPTEDFSSIDGLDDAYESFHNWPLFYLMGGGEHILEYSHLTWEGITQQFTRYDTGHGHPMIVKEYEQGYDWMHQGEGYLFFYLLCLADPTEKNVERAKRYAGFYLNEDPEAPNYDAEKKLIRCAHNGSMGPAHRNFEKHYTVYRYAQWKPWPLPFHDIPGIETVEDLQKPGMEEKMGQTLVERMSRGDVACNLAATSMVTNAYLCSGDDKYRAWVEEYTNAWIERTRQNNGILPDNVGLSGQIGEYIDGKWYGGYYGWTWPHGWHHLSDACIAAAENAALLSGDLRYMDFPRSQIDVLMQQGEMRGQTLYAPHFYHDKGWDGYSPMQAHPTTHLWCMSMQQEDMARLQQQRNHDGDNWRQVSSHFSKHGGGPRSGLDRVSRRRIPRVPGRNPAAQSRASISALGLHARRPARSCHVQRRISTSTQSHHRRGLGATDDGCSALHVQRRPAHGPPALLRPSTRPAGLAVRRGRLGGIAGRRAGRPALGQPAPDRRARGLAPGRRFWRAQLHPRCLSAASAHLG